VKRGVMAAHGANKDVGDMMIVCAVLAGMVMLEPNRRFLKRSRH
jgi:hypothetical protein